MAWCWTGPDERRRVLEVTALEAPSDEDAEPVLLVIHVMPQYR